MENKLKQNKEPQHDANLPVSGSTFTIDDMQKAFMAGADKKNWTKVHLTGVVRGQDYVLEPVFEKWFEYYH